MFRQFENLVHSFISHGTPDIANGKDLVAFEKIAFRDILPCHVQITKAYKAVISFTHNNQSKKLTWKVDKNKASAENIRIQEDPIEN